MRRQVSEALDGQRLGRSEGGVRSMILSGNKRAAVNADADQAVLFLIRGNQAPSHFAPCLLVCGGGGSWS